MYPFRSIMKLTVNNTKYCIFKVFDNTVYRVGLLLNEIHS